MVLTFPEAVQTRIDLSQQWWDSGRPLMVEHTSDLLYLALLFEAEHREFLVALVDFLSEDTEVNRTEVIQEAADIALFLTQFLHQVDSSMYEVMTPVPLDQPDADLELSVQYEQSYELLLSAWVQYITHFQSGESQLVYDAKIERQGSDVKADKELVIEHSRTVVLLMSQLLIALGTDLETAVMTKRAYNEARYIAANFAKDPGQDMSKAEVESAYTRGREESRKWVKGVGWKDMFWGPMEAEPSGINWQEFAGEKLEAPALNWKQLPKKWKKGKPGELQAS